MQDSGRLTFWHNERVEKDFNFHVSVIYTRENWIFGPLKNV
jgi:hypothetical protein